MTIALFKERNFANALRVVIAGGILMAVYQYIFNRSLWIDEASLALNIIHKSFGELLLPLDYYQVSPIGFLYVEKLFVNIIGANEYALRLFPLLSFIASVFLFFRLSRALIGSKLFVLTAVAMYSINMRSIYFASEVKQYSTEVMICIAIMLVTLQLKPNVKKNLIIATIVGSISVWVSSAAVILLFVGGLYLFLVHVLIGKKWQVLIPLLCWALSFLAYYFAFVYHHPHTEYMQFWWAPWFFPLGTDLQAISDFLYDAILSIYAFHLRAHYVWVIPAAISILGVFFLAFERRWRELYFLLMPVFVHLLLSSLMLYPFRDRLILYLMPLTILLYTWGLYYLWKIIHQGIIKVPVGAVLGAALLAFAPSLLRFPLERHEMKKGITMIAENIGEDDIVYVFGGGKPSFQFYHEKDALLAGHKIIMAESFALDVEASARDIEHLNGKIWMVFSYHKNAKPGSGQHPAEMISWLDTNGYSVLSEEHHTGCSVYEIGDDNTESK